MIQKTVLILANSDVVLYNFRRELLEALLKRGDKVVISAPYGKRIEYLKEAGCAYVETILERHGKNPFKELRLLRFYKKLIREIQPDIVLTYTIKPNIYGGMACKALKVPYLANITGLGDAIENGGLLQKITLFLYKKALKNAKCVFFQNEANRDFFLEKGIVGSQYVLLPGSGVNLQQFAYLEYPPEGANHFLFIGRITKDKGVRELAQTVSIIQGKYKDVFFDIVGALEMESNPFEGIEGCICHGMQMDVKSFIQDAHAIVLPSYHEGMANVLLEAASCGRPILASNIPGCQETFDEGVTGFGFEAKNVESLCEAIEKFIALPYEQKQEMGKASRKKVEEQFNRQIVVNKYLEQINSL